MQCLHEHPSKLTSGTSDVLELVGKMLHRFETDGEQLYPGVVVSYNAVSKLDEVAYDNEDDHCFLIYFPGRSYS